ncbi:hypothetical protein [Novosphingopyxis sp.]|uniref:hypothetical protein n=1 Tax=Novosphingopyxis sp. TaxID=2709690 RepID=UPI003B5B0BFA
MNKVKLRRTLVSIHLYLAALLAPAFLLMAVTGGLYLADVHGESREIALPVIQGFRLDADDPAIESKVRRFIDNQDLNVAFDYLRTRGDTITTRPTTRGHLRFETKDGVTSAILVKPDLLTAATELHKGHGPRIMRYYGMLVGLALFLVVIGGLVVGLLAPGYRKPTILSTIAGTALFAVLILYG